MDNIDKWKIALTVVGTLTGIAYDVVHQINEENKSNRGYYDYPQSNNQQIVILKDGRSRKCKRYR